MGAGGVNGFAKLWIYALIALPVYPRVEVFGGGGGAFLLDDLILAVAVISGIGQLLLRASVFGALTLPYTKVSVLFASLLVLKTVTLLVLAVFLPLINSVFREYGVAFGEGCFVVVKSLFFLLAYTTILKGLGQRRDSRSALHFAIFCIFLVASYGLFQFFVLGHTTITSTHRNIYAMSIAAPGIWEYDDPWFQDATVGHEHFGAYMVMALSLCVGLLLCGYPKRRRWRCALILLCGGCLFNVIYASSRGSWIGAVCSLSVFTLWLLATGKVKQLFFISLSFSVAIVSIVYALELSPVEYVGKRVESLLTSKTFGAIISNTQNDIEDVSARDRIATFVALWERFSERPLVGWGAGGAGRIAEGQYIRELVEGGIVGSVLFMAFLVSCVWGVRAHYRASYDPMVKGGNLGMACGIAGIAGQSLFTELLILTKVGGAFWVLVSIIQSMGLQRNEK